MVLDTQVSLLSKLWTILTGDTLLKNAMGGTVRLYLTWAEPNARFPYLVHRIDIAPQEFFPMRQATYYLDLWSYQPKADEILNIRKRIIELLDELSFDTDEVSATRLWLQTDGFIPEVEQNIWHYATQWNLRYYRKAETLSIISR